MTLTDINLYLTQQDKITGVDTVVWSGTVNPTEEIDNIGTYIALYTSENLAQFNYYGRATYTGLVTLDTNHVTGELSVLSTVGQSKFWPYTVTDGTNPIQGAVVWISTDAAGANIIWTGATNAAGLARDQNNLDPLLQYPKTYYFWVQHANYNFPVPDAEFVS